MKSPLPVSLAGRDLLRISDLVPAEIDAILDLAEELKGDRTPRLPGRRSGSIFGQPSTRTRISFGVAIVQLGGGFVTLTPQEMQLSRGESLSDTAHVLSRYLDALAMRVLSHDELEAVGRGGRHPGDQRAHLRRAPVPGARRRAHDPASGSVASRASGSAGSATGRTCSSRSPHIGEAHRDGGRRGLPRGLRAARRDAADARPRPARGGARRRRARHRHLGLARPGGRRASSGCATSSPTGSTRRCVALAAPDAIVLHCLPAHPGEEIAAGRALRRRARPCGTRPRTGCTCRRRSSRCCSASDAPPELVERRLSKFMQEPPTVRSAAACDRRPLRPPSWSAAASLIRLVDHERVPERLGRHVVGDPDGDHRRLRRRHAAARLGPDRRRRRDALGRRLHLDHHRDHHDDLHHPRARRARRRRGRTSSKGTPTRRAELARALRRGRAEARSSIEAASSAISRPVATVIGGDPRALHRRAPRRRRGGRRRARRSRSAVSRPGSRWTRRRTRCGWGTAPRTPSR